MKEIAAKGMEVARYAIPYFAKRDLADCESLDLRDWKRPASRPYFLVVSSSSLSLSLSLSFSCVTWSGCDDDDDDE